MTDNRTTERVDHPPRVRGAIDELMREKDAIDNRTTELREKLREHDVEYEPTKFSSLQTTFTANGIEWIVTEREATGELFVEPRHGLTLEQAVAATLGNDDDYERKMDALLCRLTNGKWSKSRAYDLDFMEQCINEEFETLYAEELADAELGNGTLTAKQVRKCVRVGACDHGLWGALDEDTDWQAIADELNARAERTCEVERIERNNPEMFDDFLVVLTCGCWFDWADATPPNYCPLCGAKVRDE